jgi:hypothetical protein
MNNGKKPPKPLSDGTGTSNGPYDSTDEASSSNKDSSSDGELLPGDIVAAKEIINLKKELKEEKRLRSKEKTAHKTAIGRLKTTNTNKYNALQTKCDTSERRFLDLNQRFEAEHFTLGLRDKEIKNLKISEKKVDKEYKAEIVKYKKDFKSELGEIDFEIKRLKDECVKPLRKELKDTKLELETTTRDEKISRQRLSKLRLDYVDSTNAAKKYEAEMRRLSSELDAATKKVDNQLLHKLANAKEVEQLKLDQELEKKTRWRSSKKPLDKKYKTSLR